RLPTRGWCENWSELPVMKQGCSLRSSPFVTWPCSAAHLGDVVRRRTLLALHDVELDGLTLCQRLEALALDGRVMHEAVLLTAVGGNETKTLGVVEPLHLAGGTHSVLLIVVLSEFRCCRTCRRCARCQP